MRALITRPTTQGCNFHSPLSKTRPCRTRAALAPLWLEVFSKSMTRDPSEKQLCLPLSSATSILHLLKNILLPRHLLASARLHERELRPCPNPASLAHRQPSAAGSGYSQTKAGHRVRFSRVWDAKPHVTNTELARRWCFFSSNPLISSHVSVWWGAHRDRFGRGGKTRWKKLIGWTLCSFHPNLLLGRVDCISSGKTVATTITTLNPSARARPEVGMSPCCPLLGFLCVASSS